jgi:hypothetical protein
MANTMAMAKKTTMAAALASRRVRGKTPEALRKVRIASTQVPIRLSLRTALSMGVTTYTHLDPVVLQVTNPLTFRPN